jgi:hypothetical protein
MTPKQDLEVDPRVVHDYRALNENTIKDHTPLPRQDVVLERMVRAFIRGKIDLKDAYYQIRVREGDIWKTAIKTPFGLYEWVVMPQGLCNAPATFQRYMNFILREYIGDFCEAYMDDIGIYSNSVAEHKRHVALILQVLRDHGIVASEKKSVLFADKIEFLGHTISSNGIEPSSEKLGKVSSWPTPRSASDIKSFLGFVNYLAANDFIPALADQSSVLTDLTKKNVAFRWEKKHDDAFKMIKKLAASIRLLQRIDYESGDTVWLIADASSKGIGGYVAQGKDWKNARPIGFFSRQYRSAEFNYPVHEQEMLAIVECMKHWEPQLTDTRFEVLSDHAPLIHWKTQRDLSKRQIRWLDFLCDFDFDIHYIPGITNTCADPLSRYPHANVQVELNALSTSDIHPTVIQRIKNAYDKDTFFGPIIKNPEQYPRWTISNGLIYTDNGRLGIPTCKSTRESLLYQHHDNENHFARNKTRKSLRRLYFWPTMGTDAETYVKSCPTCIANKSSTQSPAGYLHPLPIPHERFSDIAMDFVGPLAKSKGHDMILVMTDRLTNYVRIEPTLSTATAQDIASLVYRTWCRMFGLPHRIVSDRDSLFTSHFWQHLHRLLNIKLKMSTSFHPETDGSSERSNKTAIEALHHYVNRRQTDWMDHLIHVETQMNNSVNATTNFSPTELVFGSRLRLFPTFREGEIDTTATTVPAVTEHLDRIVESVAIARDNQLTAKTLQTKYANRSRRADPEHAVGEMVMLDSRNIRRRIKGKGKSAKLYPRYLGPFKVIKARPETSNYQLELLPATEYSSIYPVFHAKLLRKYIPNDPELFPSREPTRPPPVIPEDDRWEVEEIRDIREKRGKKEYLVHWKGYPDSDDSWVKEKDIDDEIVKEYHLKLVQEEGQVEMRRRGRR